MPYSTALAKLREAIAAEHDTIREELKRHLAVYEKMARYQRDGVVMSVTELAEWAAAVEAVSKIRNLQGRPIEPAPVMHRGSKPDSSTEFVESRT